MAISLKYQLQRSGNRGKPRAKLFLKWLSQGLGCILVFFAIAYCAFWCLDPKHFPISSVRFIGYRHQLSQEDLRSAALAEIHAGFFRLKVSALQQHLLTLPAMKQVNVRKVWPDQLVVYFEEHTPAAYWGKQGVISDLGALYFPNSLKVYSQDLPILQGPEGKSNLVWQQYLVMAKTLSPLNLTITHVILAPRGAWHLRLSNGMTVVLGTSDIFQRLERFVRAYPKHLHVRQQEIAYVDMRYTSGMAVGWRAV